MEEDDEVVPATTRRDASAEAAPRAGRVPACELLGTAQPGGEAGSAAPARSPATTGDASEDAPVAPGEPGLLDSEAAAAVAYGVDARAESSSGAPGNDDSGGGDRAIVREIEAVIANFSNEEKSAYLNAMNRRGHDSSSVPDGESPFHYFYHFRRDDGRRRDLLDAAARAVAQYWAVRRDVFGEDRYALPMDLTGDGAVAREDGAALESGAVCSLPKDRDGRSTVCFDLTKTEKDPASSSVAATADDDAARAETRRLQHLRAGFYLWHVAATENAKSAATSGMVILCCLNLSDASRLASDVPWELFGRSLPFAPPPCAIHIALLASDAPEQERRPSIDDALEALEPILSQVIGSDLEDRVYVHVCNAEDPPASLARAGLSRRNLPACIGGGRTDSDAQYWVMSRRALEMSKKVVSLRALRQEERVAYPVKHQKLNPSKRKREEPSSVDPSKPPFSSPSKPSKKKAGVWTKRRPAIDPKRHADVDHAAMALDDDSKRAYAEAKDLVPDLVKKETDPLDFFAATEPDVHKAAERLASNWTMRKELFSSRAFLPLTQTGEGALNRADLSMLSNGVILVLPADAEGRPVVYFDATKLGTEIRSPFPRLAFYMLSVACEVSAAPNRGFVIVMSLQSDSGAAQASIGDVLDVIPGQLASCHVVCYQALSDRPDLTEDHFREIAKSYFGPLPESKLHVHMDRSRLQALDRLGAHGLLPASLPKSIGGSWGVERFVEWCELRTRFEWDLPPAASHKGIEKVFDFSLIKAPSMLDEDDRIERARRMNVLHSRRKRERERIEIEVLVEQCDEMRALKVELLQESSHLQALLITAQSIVASLPPGDFALNFAPATNATVSEPDEWDGGNTPQEQEVWPSPSQAVGPPGQAFLPVGHDIVQQLAPPGQGSPSAFAGPDQTGTVPVQGAPDGQQGLAPAADVHLPELDAPHVFPANGAPAAAPVRPA